MATRSLPRIARPEPPTRYRREKESRRPKPKPVDWKGAGAMIKQSADTKTTHWPTLGQILDPEQNSFGVLRLLLALAVLVSHSFYLWYGTSTAEPLYKWTGYTLGQHAVQVFFFLSGVLVAQSLTQSQSVRDYAIARGLRIFPALIVCVLVTVLGIGPWLTTLSTQEYLTSPATAVYILKTISLSTGSAPLPGLFESNPAAAVVNSSLWTLKYEVLCYVILAAIGFIAIQSKRAAYVTGAALTVWFLVMLQQRPSLTPTAGFAQVLMYFTLFFGTGVAAYMLRDQIRISGHMVAALALASVWTNKTNFQEIMLAITLGYGALWLATFRFGGLRGFTNQSDYSYGVYIYGVPLTQAILTLMPNINLVSLIGFALASTLLAAFLSWELIERPALRLKRRWTRRNMVIAIEQQAHITAAASTVVTGEDVSPVGDRANTPNARTVNTRMAMAEGEAALRAKRLAMAAQKPENRLQPGELEQLRARLMIRRVARSPMNGHAPA